MTQHLAHAAQCLAAILTDIYTDHTWVVDVGERDSSDQARDLTGRTATSDTAPPLDYPNPVPNRPNTAPPATALDEHTVEQAA